MEDWEEVFEELEDPRTGNAKRHPLHEVLMIARCAVLCVAGCADMALFGRAKRDFFQEFLTLSHGIASHDTFNRIFRLVDPASFQAWFIGFMQRFAEGCQGVFAIDGKPMRRSFERATQPSPLHLVSAWAADARLCLGKLRSATNRVRSWPCRSYWSFWRSGPGRHRRCDGLPAQDCAAGDRPGRRLRACAQGQPGDGTR